VARNPPGQRLGAQSPSEPFPAARKPTIIAIMPTPDERDMAWLWSRPFWLASTLLLAAFGVWLGLALRGPIAGHPGVVAVVGLEGSQRALPGSVARYRVHARDLVTGGPLANETAKVELRSYAPGRDAKLPLVEGKTDATGQWLAEVKLPDPMPEGLRWISATLPGHPEAWRAEIELIGGTSSSTFLSSDKPWYQPGQTIHLRSLTLADDGNPVAGETVTFEAKTEDGTKVFSETKKTSAHGIASADFVLADEVKLGRYRVEVRGRRVLGDLSVDVKRYALPKGKVSLELDPSSDVDAKTLSGRVSAVWSFGKPLVKAGVTLHFGTTSSAAVFSGKTDDKGSLRFQVPRGGSPLLARVSVEGGTPFEAQLEVPRAKAKPQMEVFVENGEPVLGVENEVFVVTSDAAGNPLATQVGIEPHGGVLQTNERGIGSVRLMMTPEALPWTFNLDTLRDSVQATLSVRRYHGNPELLLRTAHPTLPAGQTVPVRVLASPELDGEVLLGLWKGAQLTAVASGTLVNGAAEIPLVVPARTNGLVRLEATRFTASGPKVGRRMLLVEGASLALKAQLDRPRHAPGETAVIDLSVTGPGGRPTRAALGLSAVDEAFFALADVRPDLEQRFFTIDRALRDPERTSIGSRSQEYRLHPSATRVAPETSGTLDGTPALDDVRNVALAVVSARRALSTQRDMDWDRRRIPWATSRRAERLGGIASLTALALAALALLGFLVYGVKRIREPAFVDAQAVDQERWMVATSGLFVALAVGLLVPWVAALSVITVRDSRVSKEQVVGAVWLLGALAAATWQAHVIRRTGDTAVGRACPGLRRALWLLPTAYFFAELSIAAAVAGNGQWERRLLVDTGRHIALVLVVLTLYQLAFGALSVVRQSAVSTTTRRRRLWLFASRPVFVGLPLTLLALGYFTYRDVKRTPDEDFDEYIEDSYDTADSREGGTGTRAKGEEGSMGNPNRRYAVKGPAENAPSARPLRVRSYFPETLLWMPEIVTDLSGNARVEVPLADSITQYRLSVSAVSDQGLLGSLSLPLEVFQDFFVDVTVPATLTQGDEVTLPVTVFNYLEQPETVKLELEAPGFSTRGAREQTVVLGPRETRGTSFAVTAKLAGQQLVRVKASGTKLADALERKILVHPNGMPVEQLENGLLSQTTRLTTRIPENAIAGGSELTLKVYGGILSQLAESLDGVLARPHGCFEQTSSTTYPNVLVLDFLKRSGSSSPEIERRARAYIDEGYQRLLTFEVSGGGFDWFGRGPANVLLSAYGLLELSDMAKVRPVDEEVLERTRTFLYSKQRSDGTWEYPRHAVYSALSTSSDELATAYVAWALARAGERDPRLDRALARVEQHLTAAGDYELAIAGNALAAAGRKQPALTAATRLAKSARREPGRASWTSEQDGMFYGYGASLGVELTALASHLLSVLDVEPELRKEARAHLVARRESSGAWATTSATVAALRALLDDVPHLGTADQKVSIRVNDVPAGNVIVSKGKRDVYQLVSLSEKLQTGENVIALDGPKNADIAFQLVTLHHVPWTSAARSGGGQTLALQVGYSPTSVSVGKVVDCSVEVAWSRDRPAAMPLVEVGVPPGFEVETEDLEALRAKREIERYSLGPNRVTLYLFSLVKDAPKRFTFRLRAVLPVRAVAPAAKAYAYYEPEVSVRARPFLLTAR